MSGKRTLSPQAIRWLANRLGTRGRPSFFTPADLPGIGSFQDGGLKHNFAGEIASQVSRQIWPEAIGSTRLLSLGTGVAKPEVDPTPHFRHIFRDSFLRRGFDAWMSTLDTEGDWRKLKGQLNVAVRSDYHRLNVELNGTPNTIDSVETMDDYRNLVLGQPGNSRRARQAATTLLVSRFFFELTELPENTAAPFWCRGSIRCKGSARDVIMALTRLYPEGLTYVSGKNMVDSFHGLDDLCVSCGSYLRPLSFMVHHFNHPVDLFLQASPTHRWRLSGFPESLANFAAKQGLTSSFGHSSHGIPGRIACGGCETLSGSSQTKRRKRGSTQSRGGSKKVCLTLVMGGPDPHRLVRKKLKQRSKTLKSKAIELATQCDAEVYLLICSSRETYVYNSNKDDPSWPPPDHDLVLLRKHSESHYAKIIRSQPSSRDCASTQKPNCSTKSMESSIQLDCILEYFAERRQLLGEALVDMERRHSL
ncbi:unnamed protein product [Penicillium salamii]|uniref:MADS-box domain-containing protein n=1 Tax=Penicillium salamii TaxID=1612424 RepID=A0A9W4JZB1_9EURO|nr:unnamed protein product [Penicillium salamii]CAG8029681.1 unnamed protein product [Penicillium salamii]CAG8064675.1 unnamed protein product [Penicillium salamii]CAG8309057.1 unnamed protein product [Penicillium salamii]CAG8316050.1 unnamed protein product [Penicillium salamii]